MIEVVLILVVIDHFIKNKDKMTGILAPILGPLARQRDGIRDLPSTVVSH
jgi:hypothetical protein